MATLDLAAGAVATSGTGERGAHLWDRRVDAPARELLSLTVTGPSLTWADAFATAAFVMGEAGVEWVSQFEDYRAIALLPNHTLLHSAF